MALLPKTGVSPIMTKMEKICVLGSGTVRMNSPVYRQAEELGRALARAGFSVYHGGYGGVMEAVAKGCREAGGHNSGVTIAGKRRPSNAKRHGNSLFVASHIPRKNPYTSAEIKVPSWEKRLLKLIEMGDAYVFLDGATGTMNELFFVWEMANRGLHAKPILLLGKELHQLVKFLKKNGMVKIPENFHRVATIQRVVKYLVERRGRD
ncbi:MAG: LOG family protein ORF6 in fasciation locus [Candidatus Omnitrophica bacterium ADurb.Bin292]|nr:MAG: LOG family protein ORF6 in fasciation locus [Candidatus Omnitrophica bacterium ADurb.Bin292]